MKKFSLFTILLSVGIIPISANGAGFNKSTLTIFDSIQHVDTAFLTLLIPLDVHGIECVRIDDECALPRQRLIFDANIFGGVSNLDSGGDTDFYTMRKGMSIGVKGFINDNMAIGLQFIRGITDVKDSIEYDHAATSSVTMIAEYISHIGLFINGGINLGNTHWSGNGPVTGAFDNGFFAGQVVGGIKLNDKATLIMPQIGLRYLHMTPDKYTDMTYNRFDSWSHGILTGIIGIHSTTRLTHNVFSIAPDMSIGATYDFVNHGDESILIRPTSAPDYYMSIITPDSAAVYAGIGMNIAGPAFIIALNYRLDGRRNFMSHTTVLDFKISF